MSHNIQPMKPCYNSASCVRLHGHLTAPLFRCWIGTTRPWTWCQIRNRACCPRSINSVHQWWSCALASLLRGITALITMSQNARTMKPCYTTAPCQQFYGRMSHMTILKAVSMYIRRLYMIVKLPFYFSSTWHLGLQLSNNYSWASRCIPFLLVSARHKDMCSYGSIYK